jgi:prepilin-type N-terminal cleavage/methylation domain-containing protein/prepilin-type processing-associated H-X9-DG protein
MMSGMTRRRAFTLIELLVVIAIIAVLVGLLLPAIQKVREAASRLRCANHLKQLALAAHGYHDANDRLPGAVEMGAGRHKTLFVELLPYVEQAPLYQQWDFVNPNANYGGTGSRASTVLQVLLCPSHPLQSNPAPAGSLLVALTTYGGNGGFRAYPAPQATLDGMFHTTGPGSQPGPNQRGVTLLAVTDGTSNTLLFGERVVGDPGLDSYLQAPLTPAPDPPVQSTVAYYLWAPPPGVKSMAGLLTSQVTVNYSHPDFYVPPPPPPPPLPLLPPPPVPWGPLSTLWWARLGAYGSYHPGGANVAMVDGSVRSLPASLPLATLRALSTRAGGEVVPGDF